MHAAYVKAAGTTVAVRCDEYKAAASSTSATGAAVASTTALGENSVVDANSDGLIVTATTAGANATGLITVQMFYVLD